MGDLRNLLSTLSHRERGYLRPEADDVVLEFLIEAGGRHPVELCPACLRFHAVRLRRVFSLLSAGLTHHLDEIFLAEAL